MKTLRRSLTFALAFAIAIPMAAAPLVIASEAAAASTTCASHNSGTDRQVADSRGYLREPALAQVAKASPARVRGLAASDFSATVDVYFHVVTDGALGNLTNRQINAQIAVLNKEYAGREGGANTGFSFVLAGVTRTENAKWFAVKPGAEKDMKKSLKQGDDSDLNVYSTTAADFLGWAYYPSVTDSNQAYLDGIVLDWETLPGVSDTYAGRFDLGKTLTHEAGHWLNLAHTFDGGCADPGDFVADTPAEATPTSGCPAGKDTCTAPGLDPIHNYMDYSYDSCYTQFTPGQGERMQEAWLAYRAQ